jgi:hypothetical protein
MLASANKRIAPAPVTLKPSAQCHVIHEGVVHAPSVLPYDAVKNNGVHASSGVGDGAALVVRFARKYYFSRNC